MSNDWILFSEIDFTDETVNQFNIDTRDFHCGATKTEDFKIDLEKISKYPLRFFYTLDELKFMLKDIFERSGGTFGWRMLCFIGEGTKETSHWELKYLRIKRLEDNKFVVCDNNHRVLKKVIFECEINKEFLHAH